MAVQGFYGLTTKIKEILEQDINVNTVSYGDLFEVAKDKHVAYPISHFMVTDVEIRDNLYVFNIAMVCMDLIDVTKEDLTDLFAGNDNTHDIFHTQLLVIRRLFKQLKHSDIRKDGYELLGNPSVEAFKDRFQDGVAGWSVSFQVAAANTLNVC